jgi:hypothetical protein
MKINGKQIIALLLYSPILYSLFKDVYEKGSNITFILSLIYLFFLYLVFRSIWILATPLDNKINFKNNVAKVISGGICPFCRQNDVSTNKLKIGYRKRLWSFGYKIIYFSYSTTCHELFTRIYICNPCEEKYKKNSNSKFYALFARNPSKKLLKMKYGYKIGIQYPFEAWNITKE